MGISIMKFSAGCNATRWIPAPDPDPKAFKVLDTKTIGTCTLALVHYPGCTTYGGRKLLFYDRRVNLASWDAIDPHFLENDHSPFARFEPTVAGRSAAILLATQMSNSSL